MTLTRELRFFELLENGNRREWSFGHHDVYDVTIAARMGFGGSMEDTVLRLPPRITAAIVFRDLPPFAPEGQYTALGNDSDDKVPWKNLRELRARESGWTGMPTPPTKDSAETQPSELTAKERVG